MSEKQLYFAYGSNLNQEDLQNWCDTHFQRRLSLRFVSLAKLPDYELAFTYYSQTRHGGVLDVRPRMGRLVSGAVFQVDEHSGLILDRKEGAPSVYERIPVTLIDDNNCLIRAFTYRVRPVRSSPYVAPSSEYLTVVKNGLSHFQLPTASLEAAAGNIAEVCECGFFFYGTLMRNESRFHVLERFGIDCALIAEAPGRLLDLGDFPGLVHSANSEGFVRGEYVRLRNAEQAIRELDLIEGFHGYGRSDSLFVRSLTTVHLGDGRLRSAWVYCLNSNTELAAEVRSNCWRTHCGRRDSFLTALVAQHCQGDELGTAERIIQRDQFLAPSQRPARIRAILPLRESLARGVVTEREIAKVTGKWVAIP